MISMSKIKGFLRRTNYKARHDFFTLENVVLGLAILLCLVWTYQSVAATSRNWELSERLTEERRNLELLSLEVEAAEIENAYYQSAEYQELMARRNLDKKYEGENMVVMPENSAEAKGKYKNQVAQQTSEIERSNLEKWLMYLFPKY